MISSDQVLNSNPSLSKAIHAFETGEMLHTVGTCIICLETRPVFHCVDNKAKVKIEPWKLSKKGCKRCADDQRKKCEVPLFSGCRSVEEHLGPKTHELRHNNMHFEDVPPFLQNLTALESSLVSKVSVGIRVHILRYGMLASKGHCISLPNKMAIATQLPLLPEEVGIVILKKKGGSSVPKQYTVSRHAVQDALNGLCFGYPKGGSDQL